jgi:hypothetical protein
LAFTDTELKDQCLGEAIPGQPRSCQRAISHAPQCGLGHIAAGGLLPATQPEMCPCALSPIQTVAYKEEPSPSHLCIPKPGTSEWVLMKCV